MASGPGGGMTERTFVVRLFPDSGHQIYFVPIAVPQTYADVPEAVEYCKLNSLPPPEQPLAPMGKFQGLLTSTPEPDWMPASDTKGGIGYLRGKLGIKVEKIANPKTKRTDFEVYGLWCGIETNTGSAQHGYSYDSIKPATQGDAGWLRERARLAGSTPYVASKPSAVNYRQPQRLDLTTAFGLSEKTGLPLGNIILEINWLPRRREVPVHLIVDFGNTRTIAFGLERGERQAAAGGLREICFPISFQPGLDDAKTVSSRRPRGSDLVPDSWIILREPQFASRSFLPPYFFWPDYRPMPGGQNAVDRIKSWFGTRKPPELAAIVRRVPYMFIEFSPVVIGPEATKILANADISGGHLSFLSSPKRYAWDNEAGTHWYMHSRNDQKVLLELGGQMFLFLPRHSQHRDWVLEDVRPPPTEWPDPSKKPVAAPDANFGRGDSLIWTALSLIERASRQIESESWRSRNAVPRFLERVVVTFPPGWTNEEFLAYFNAWRLATEIYNWTRGPRPDGPKVRLDVDLPVDEAFASQLAIVFSEIHHLGDRARGWIELYGRQRGTRRTVRALTIDIGGGTLDTAVVEYHGDETKRFGVHVKREILFSDSSTTAGDKLVKDLIERVLLPKLGEGSRIDPSRRAIFERAARGSGTHRPEEDRLRRMVVTRAVFVPMAFKWLEDVSSGLKGGEQGTYKHSPSDCGADQHQITELNELFSSAGVEGALMVPNQGFDVEYARINSTIVDWCRPIADLHARYVAAFECDLVIVTGKPSELPQVREVLEERLPIDPHRIVFAKDYYAGSWFPAGSDGKIPDAKMVTVVGAALHQAMEKTLIPQWQVEEIISPQAPARNYWGVIRRPGIPFDDDDILMSAEENEITDKVPSFCIIGRARFPQNVPEPVYILRWRDPKRRETRCSIDVMISRIRVGTSGRPLRNEHLRLENVYGQEESGRMITLDDFELCLRTLPQDETHWLDRGRFEVKWD
jgi:Virulence factor SrfB